MEKCLFTFGLTTLFLTAITSVSPGARAEEPSGRPDGKIGTTGGKVAQRATPVVRTEEQIKEEKIKALVLKPL